MAPRDTLFHQPQGSRVHPKETLAPQEARHSSGELT